MLHLQLPLERVVFRDAGEKIQSVSANVTYLERETRR